MPNNVPQLIHPIGVVTSYQEVPLLYTIPPNTFQDRDADPLTYTAVMVDSNNTVIPFPAWLSFNPTTQYVPRGCAMAR